MFYKRSLRSVCLIGLCLASLGAQAVEPGQPAPNLQAPSLTDNKTLQLSQYQGQVIYLDFWASWCPPCAQSFPVLNKLRNELHDQGFEVIGVNLDKEPAKALEFLKAYPVQFPLVSDAQGVWPQQYGVKGMPYAYLIDRQGTVRQVLRGFNSGHLADITSQVKALLKEPVGSVTAH